jgi:ATP-dependent Clp protease adaptor protein ClpS
MSTTITKPKTDTQSQERTKQPWLWNVVLLNDEAHTYDYVISMMKELFAHPETKGALIAKSVDKEGRAVVLTTHKEHAEFKQEQIHAFGRDKFIAGCAGAMSAIIEPAEFSGDDSDNAGGSNDKNAGGQGGQGDSGAGNA